MLTDTYAYNTLDQLTSYTGYDGYTQQFAYDANGRRLSMSEAGDANRSTLEELLREKKVAIILTSLAYSRRTCLVTMQQCLSCLIV